MTEPTIGTYRDAGGAEHQLVVDRTADGGWRVLDLDPGSETAHVVETLAVDQDGRPQAEAIARDYLTTVARSPQAAGREPGQDISQPART